MNAAASTLIALLQNAGISFHLFEAPFLQPESFDLGLRMLLLPNEDKRYASVLQRVQRLKGQSLYHLQDVFGIHYALMKLPDEEQARWLSLGPTLIEPPGGEEIMALLKELKLPGSLYHSLRDYYERLPVLNHPETFDAVAFSVADLIFSGREYYTVKLIHNSAEPDALQQLIAHRDSLQAENLEQEFAHIQRRYELENAFLKATVTGDARTALAAHSAFVRFASGLKRMPDRLRDTKDLGITLNSLLRKSAEEAGVHPYYINAHSNANVVRLEQCSNEIQLHMLYQDFVQGYCDLIRQYALSPYSKPVQEAIYLIQSDLSADLSLAAVAKKLNLNRSYLSTCFTREVGEPLSAYVLEKRILRAEHLLSSTPLSIQEIAWEVGFPDANYFSRLFKRETGLTPREFRKANKRRV